MDLLEYMLAVPNCAGAEVLRRLAVTEGDLRAEIPELSRAASPFDLARAVRALRRELHDVLAEHLGEQSQRVDDAIETSVIAPPGRGWAPLPL